MSPRMPRRQPKDFKVPNDLSDLLPCPVCDRSGLCGVLVAVGEAGRWWTCSECWLTIPATETARKTIIAFQREA